MVLPFAPATVSCRTTRKSLFAGLSKSINRARPPRVSPVAASLYSTGAPLMSKSWNQRLFSTSVGWGGRLASNATSALTECGRLGLIPCTRSTSRRGRTPLLISGRSRLSKSRPGVSSQGIPTSANTRADSSSMKRSEILLIASASLAPDNCDFAAGKLGSM